MIKQHRQCYDPESKNHDAYLRWLELQSDIPFSTVFARFMRGESKSDDQTYLRPFGKCKPPRASKRIKPNPLHDLWEKYGKVIDEKTFKSRSGRYKEMLRGGRTEEQIFTSPSKRKVAKSKKKPTD